MAVLVPYLKYMEQIWKQETKTPAIKELTLHLRETEELMRKKETGLHRMLDYGRHNGKERRAPRSGAMRCNIQPREADLHPSFDLWRLLSDNMDRPMPLKEKFNITIPLKIRGIEYHAKLQKEHHVLVRRQKQNPGESIGENLYCVFCQKGKAG